MRDVDIMKTIRGIEMNGFDIFALVILALNVVISITIPPNKVVSTIGWVCALLWFLVARYP